MAIHQHIIINTRKTYALAAITTQLVLQMMLLLLFIQETSAQQSSKKPGCQQTCGSLQITYPFGIGADCSAHKKLEISCNNSYNPPKAFLNDNNLEVLDISLETGTVRVNSPVIKSCDTSDDQKVLSSGTFTFSGTRNQFTAMGCETLAVITQQGLRAGGCMTFCNSTTYIFTDNTCFGFCCQTKIPLSLNLINTSFRSIDAIKYQNVCRHAFIVDQDWFGSLTNIISVRTMEHVPAVLDWSWRPDGRCYSFNYVDPPVNGSACGRNAFCTDQVLCSCRTGYEGNPYLPNGCQDIDECATGVDNCQICTNMPGSYRCSCRYGWEHDGKNCNSLNKKVLILIIIATGAGLGFLIAAMWWLYKVIRRRNIRKLKETFFKRNGGLLLQQQVSSSEGNIETTKLFTSKELEKATDHYNIDRIIGQGGQGTVYKGMLTDGRIVAVKKSKIEGGSKLEQFINEVVILSQINHRNVVKLHGCCLETEVPLLVYEFIPNGTLFQYIHDHNEDFPLTWDICVRVATEIAGALSYLHSSASIPIYHRDIKSTNILLDDKYRVKVADFGTSRSISIDQTHVTTKVQGTFGYLDPEYFQSTQFTDKSDVYSFGVVLVELLTGQKPILEPRPDDETRSLATHFILAMQEDRILDVLDPRIMIDGKKEEIIAFSNLAFRCLNMNGRNRPTMKQVAAVLESIRMSNGLHTAQKHYEDVDHAGAELYGAWDLKLTSRSSSIDKSLTIDIEPLITIN